MNSSAIYGKYWNIMNYVKFLCTRSLKYCKNFSTPSQKVTNNAKKMYKREKRSFI